MHRRYRPIGDIGSPTQQITLAHYAYRN